jgi:hypothetical protein
MLTAVADTYRLFYHLYRRCWQHDERGNDYDWASADSCLQMRRIHSLPPIRSRTRLYVYLPRKVARLPCLVKINHELCASFNQFRHSLTRLGKVTIAFATDSNPVSFASSPFAKVDDHRRLNGGHRTSSVLIAKRAPVRGQSVAHESHAEKNYLRTTRTRVTELHHDISQVPCSIRDTMADRGPHDGDRSSAAIVASTACAGFTSMARRKDMERLKKLGGLYNVMSPP